MIPTIKVLATIAFFSLFLIFCQSKQNNSSDYIGTYKIEQVSDSILLTSATLKILPNHKYEYLGKNLEFNKTFFITEIGKQITTNLVIL